MNNSINRHIFLQSTDLSNYRLNSFFSSVIAVVQRAKPSEMNSSVAPKLAGILKISRVNDSSVIE